MLKQETIQTTALNQLDRFLENEKKVNSAEPWSKLDKTTKIRKLSHFANIYKETNQLTDEEHDKLIQFFGHCLDTKKLQRVKDVIYNKENGQIKDIPALHHNKSTNHYTLKNMDKHVSTMRGLTPKKRQGTVKNIKPSEEVEEDVEVDE
jgi:hypothetical protein